MNRLDRPNRLKFRKIFERFCRARVFQRSSDGAENIDDSPVEFWRSVFFIAIRV